jgi:RND family efflux transporter MFP subunit
VLAALLGGGLGCRDHTHEPEVAAEPPALTISRWTGTHELFTEHPPLVVGRAATLAVHATRLSGHVPVDGGSVTVTLGPRSGAARAPGASATARAPVRAGLALPTVTPAAAGPCTLGLRLADGAAVSEVEIECEVHAAGAPLPAPPEEPPGRIELLKEAAWTSGLATAIVGTRELVPTLRTTGELRAAAGREARLTATAHGRVVIEPPLPVLGARVAAGQVLARIAPQLDYVGGRVTLAAEARQALAERGAAESQLARAERLWAERAIPEKQLEEARARAEVARAAVDAAQGRLAQHDASASGLPRGGAAFQIRSPIAGSLVAIHVAPGESVEDGERLFTVVDASRVWLHADVFEGDIAAVERAQRASFRVDGVPQPFVIAPPDGARVTIGHLVDEKTRTVPLIFELSNPGQRLRIGSFATVWIERGDAVRALAVPESAIVDDAGRKVAYVQVGGEQFERRVLALGIRSAGWVEVRTGLAAGDRVVVTGAYEIKLAAASGAVPGHGHAH